MSITRQSEVAHKDAHLLKITKDLYQAKLWVSADRSELIARGDILEPQDYDGTSVCERVAWILKNYPTITNVSIGRYEIGRCLDPDTYEERGSVYIDREVKVNEKYFLDLLSTLVQLPELHQLQLPGLQITADFNLDLLTQVIRKVTGTLMLSITNIMRNEKIAASEMQNQEKLYNFIRTIFANIHPDIKIFQFHLGDYSCEYHFDSNTSNRFITLMADFISKHKSLERVAFGERHTRVCLIGDEANRARLVKTVIAHPNLRIARAPIVVREQEDKPDFPKDLPRFLFNPEWFRPHNFPKLTLDELLDEALKKKEAESIHTRLRVAVGQGDLQAVNALIAEGANVNIADLSGETALHIAARMGYLPMAKVLIDNGANVKASNSSGTPIFLAAKGGYADIVMLLISKGADVNEVFFQKQTALHVAAADGSIAVVNILLEHGANVNAVDSYGQTPIFCAVEKNNVDVFNSLMLGGADLKHFSNANSTLLHIAAHNKSDKKITDILFAKGADVNAADNKKRTPLHVALLSGYTELCFTLIERGANINAPDEANYTTRTPLVIAAKQGYIDLVRLLLHKGAKLNVGAWGFCTALYAAVEHGQTEIAILLISKGEKLDNINELKGTKCYDEVMTILQEQKNSASNNMQRVPTMTNTSSNLFKPEDTNLTNPVYSRNSNPGFNQ